MTKLKKNKTQVFRFLVQMFFLVITTIAAFRHQILGGGPSGSPPVDAICPFGAIESLYKLVLTGQFIDKIDWSAVILMVGALVLVIIVGRYFCGWICTLGTMQELFGKLGFVIFKRRFEIPKKIDKPLRYLKYGILIWAIYFTWKTGTLFIRPYDPFAAYSHIPAGFTELWGEFAIGFSLLIISLIASMFYDRFFCKYACPLGGFLGIVSKISLFKIKREEKTCISCNLCDKVCPVNIEVSKVEKVDSAECIACLECVTICPTKKETLKTTIINKPKKVALIGILGLVIYLGIVGIGHVTGYWTTEKTLEEIVTVDGNLNPENIKGFMTLKEVSEVYKIDINTLYEKLKITEEQIPKDTRLKEIGEKLGLSESEFDVDKVRETVKEILNEK